MCAGAFIMNLQNEIDNIILTDSAQSARDLYYLHSESLVEYLKNCEHALYLINNGFEKDVEECLQIDTYTVVPLINGSSIKLI
jgi:phosphosulfolactate phosphohydrolase-like enzyme